jgi:predicted metal-binding membrane protein
VTIGAIRGRSAWLAISSVLAWLLLSGSLAPGLPDFCGTGHWGTALIAGMGIVVRLNPLGPQFLSWLLMLCAMMLPLLDRPIAEVGALHGSGFRRSLAVLAFLIAYIAVWMAVLLLLAAATIGLRLATSTAPLIALCVALAWQATPIKTRCLGLCRGSAIAGPRLTPELRGLCHGVATARACAGSGWALMALPFVFETAHFAVMVGTALVMLWERVPFDGGMRRWRDRGPVARLPGT